MSSHDSSASACANAALDLMQAISGFLIAEGRDMNPSARITPPQFRALILLERTPGISLTDLAGELGIRAPTASVIVVRLVRDGLVKRNSVPGRRLSLILTAKGRRVVANARQHMIDVLTNALKHWPESQLSRSIQTLESLQRISESLR
jgi:DNA-binding MarR family transcriptional regulator